MVRRGSTRVGRLIHWDMNTERLIQQAKLHDLQNRLGFVVWRERRAPDRHPVTPNATLLYRAKEAREWNVLSN